MPGTYCPVEMCSSIWKGITCDYPKEPTEDTGVALEEHLSRGMAFPHCLSLPVLMLLNYLLSKHRVNSQLMMGNNQGKEKEK